MRNTHRFALVGPGRAGTALTTALTRARWRLIALAGRSPDSARVRSAARRLGAQVRPVEGVGRGADVVIVATPDSHVGPVSLDLAPSLESGATVLHVAGALDLGVFGDLLAARPDVAVGSVHPLQTLAGSPDDVDLLEGAWVAVDGDDRASDVAAAIGGRPFRAADRAAYHAAACVASNHLVALMGQVERLADAAGVPREAFMPLIRATLGNVEARGAAGALTGPVVRGDVATVARHLEALPEGERATYRALAAAAARLADLDDPVLAALVAEPAPAGVVP